MGRAYVVLNGETVVHDAFSTDSANGPIDALSLSALDDLGLRYGTVMAGCCWSGLICEKVRILKSTGSDISTERSIVLQMLYRGANAVVRFTASHWAQSDTWNFQAHLGEKLYQYL